MNYPFINEARHLLGDIDGGTFLVRAVGVLVVAGFVYLFIIDRGGSAPLSEDVIANNLAPVGRVQVEAPPAPVASEPAAAEAEPAAAEAEPTAAEAEPTAAEAEPTAAEAEPTAAEAEPTAAEAEPTAAEAEPAAAQPAAPVSVPQAPATAPVPAPARTYRWQPHFAPLPPSQR